MPQRLVLLGPPGVGKGTQAALLHDRFGAHNISSGDIFRHEIAEHTELGNMAKSFIEHGELVPDDVTIAMMVGRLSKPETRSSGFVLDGFPRTVAQAEALDRELESMHLHLDRVVALVVEDDVVVERLSGRMVCLESGEIYHRITRPPKVPGICDVSGKPLTVRKDDEPETIRERLRVYHQTTEPLIAYYSNKGILLRVDAHGDVETIHKAIADGLGLVSGSLV